MTLDTYGHLFDDRLDEVGVALDAARTAAQQRRRTLRALPRVAPVLPKGVSAGMPKGPRPAFLLVRTPYRTRTPDRIRTGATALREREPTTTFSQVNGLLRPHTAVNCARIWHVHVVSMSEAGLTPTTIRTVSASAWWECDEGAAEVV